MLCIFGRAGSSLDLMLSYSGQWNRKCSTVSSSHGSPAKPFKVKPWNNKERLISRAKTAGWNVGRYTVGQEAWSVSMR